MVAPVKLFANSALGSKIITVLSNYHVLLSASHYELVNNKIIILTHITIATPAIDITLQGSTVRKTFYYKYLMHVI